MSLIKLNSEMAIKSSKELVAEMRTKLSSLEKEEPSLRLSDDAISNLLSLSTDALLNAQSVLVGVIGEELSKPVRTADLSTVRYEVERKIRLTESVSPSILQTLITLSRSLVVETESIHEDMTKARVAQARESVEPTRILQGQVIVREGQVIDKEIYRQLELAGVLSNQSSMKPLAGLILFVLFVGAIIYMHFLSWSENRVVKKKALLIVLVVFFLLVIMMKLISLIEKDFDVLAGIPVSDSTRTNAY